jgi:hypothetical protein
MNQFQRHAHRDQKRDLFPLRVEKKGAHIGALPQDLRDQTTHVEALKDPLSRAGDTEDQGMEASEIQIQKMVGPIEFSTTVHLVIKLITS